MTDSEKVKLFARLAGIPRTGWVQQGIKSPESVAEHIYGCWLMGTFLLPETHEDPTYDKQTVLDMLLLHDLPEAITGDIPRNEKKKDPTYYDLLEQKAAEDSLLSGNCTQRQKQLWRQWCAQDTLNARIAKDIDNLQAIFTFMQYKKQEPALFSEENSAAWLSGLDRLQTEIGKKTAADLF